MDKFWETGADLTSANEAEVEQKVVMPLLLALGHSSGDIRPKHPVIIQKGRGRNREADFVVFYGPPHNKDSALITVEAKTPGESFEKAREQAESYATAIGTPLMLITDGRDLEIWQLQPVATSERLLRCSLRTLAAHRGSIEAALAKEAVYAYCQSLRHRNAIWVTSDLSAYVKHQLTNNGAYAQGSSARTLLELSTHSRVNASSLLTSFPQGAVVIGRSGFGKSTLSAQLCLQVARSHELQGGGRVGCQALLADVALSSSSILGYVHARVQAHCPALTATMLQQTMRQHGFVLLCDAFDRLTPEQSQDVAAQLRTLRRDFPLLQLFVFTRPGALPDLALPVLELQPLADNEKRELLASLPGLEDVDAVLQALPKAVQELSPHPLFLALIGGYWTTHRRFPTRLSSLFEAWVDQLLPATGTSASRNIRLRNGLTALAITTAQTPVTHNRALQVLEEIGLDDTFFDELLTRDAIRQSGATIELHHEALADYLRAISLTGMPKDLDRYLDRAYEEEASLLLVLLASLVVDAGHRQLIWLKLGEAPLDVYLDALRFRANLAEDFGLLDSHSATLAYLTDFLEGFDSIAAHYFPHLRTQMEGTLAPEGQGRLTMQGIFSQERNWLSYRFDRALSPSEPRASVAAPGSDQDRHGINLPLSGLRADSGRLLGTHRAIEAIKEVVENRALYGRHEWTVERLLGRVRVLEAEVWECPPKAYELRDLEEMLAPHSTFSVVSGTFPPRHRFTVAAVLADIRWLMANGHTTLTPWWLAHVDARSLAPVTDHDHQAILAAHFRRTQLIYIEVCEESFPQFAAQFGMYCAMPIRWCVDLFPSHHGRSMHCNWHPVATWAEAGADVNIREARPDNRAYRGFAEMDTELQRFGRRAVGLLSGDSQSVVPDFSGHLWNGGFDGETSVMREVDSLILSDLEMLWRSAPARDGAVD